MSTDIPSPRPRLVVALATFRRTRLLAQLLPLLDEQVREAESAGWQTEILVVDNDPQESAGSVVGDASLTAPLRLVSEAEPGLAAARNRILAEAGNADLLALIDDDEQPDSQWLPALLRTMGDTGATAVTGPVESLPVRPLDDWLEGSGIFSRPHRPTGSATTGLATNNLLLDLAQLRAMNLRFDPRFGMTGGEDSMFGQTLLRRGGTIVWCDEAVVRELVPEDRLSRSWVTQRAKRFGETWVRVRTIDRPSAAAGALRLRYGMTGLARWAVGEARGLAARTRHDEGALGCAQFDSAGALGMVRGALGRAHEEYSRK